MLKLLKTQKTLQKRGELIMKEGSTKAVIRERIQPCNYCKDKPEDYDCPVCRGAKKVVCENIVNIFPYKNY